jgi:High potential iron-sulfur protein
MTTRRRFVALVPLAGSAWLAACSDKPAQPGAAPAAPAAAPTPAPAAAAAPAPAAPAEPAPGPAGNAPMVAETDPTAVSLGYVADASRADTARFKTHAPGQACGNCALFGGKAGDAVGLCPIFAGRQVAAKGWCSSYVKKAG